MFNDRIDCKPITCNLKKEFDMYLKDLTISKYLKMTRESKNLTIKDAAKCLGLTFQGLWQIENYNRPIEFSTLENISTFYNINRKTLAEINFKSTDIYKKHMAYINAIK